MSTRAPRGRLLLALIAVLGLAASVHATPAPALAAGHGPPAQAAGNGPPSRPARRTTPAPPGCDVSGGQDAVTGTGDPSQWQAPIKSTSGLTVVELPRQAVSGGRLLVQVVTVPRAHVTLTVNFADGTQMGARCPPTRDGHVLFVLPIDYQPQGSAEAATVTVEAVLQPAGLDDVVQGSVAVLQHIVLQGSLKLPRSVVAGRWLTVTVVSNQPGASVRFLLIYPDKQVESGAGGYTNAAGMLTRRFAVSRSDGTSGTLTVQVWLSYNGAQLRLSGRVALRPPNS